MKKSDLAKYRHELIAMGKRIQSGFANVAEDALRPTASDASGSLSSAPLHPADLSSDTFDHEVAVGLLENEDKLLEQIVVALGRIEEGSYGECAECGDPIRVERLKLLPYAVHCVDCAQAVEQAER